MASTKHLIIVGSSGTEEKARKILDLIPNGYRMQISPEKTAADICRIKEFPYMKMVFVNDAPNEISIVKSTKNIQLFNTEASIVFTCSRACPALKMDNRYNIIELEQ